MPKIDVSDLTDTQAMVLRFVRSYLAVRGRTPTIPEVRETLGLRGYEATRDVLDALAARGRLRRGDPVRYGCRHYYLPDGLPGLCCPACRATREGTP